MWFSVASLLPSVCTVMWPGACRPGAAGVSGRQGPPTGVQGQPRPGLYCRLACFGVSVVFPGLGVQHDPQPFLRGPAPPSRC